MRHSFHDGKNRGNNKTTSYSKRNQSRNIGYKLRKTCQRFTIKAKTIIDSSWVASFWFLLEKASILGGAIAFTEWTFRKHDIIISFIQEVFLSCAISYQPISNLALELHIINNFLGYG